MREIKSADTFYLVYFECIEINYFKEQLFFVPCFNLLSLVVRGLLCHRGAVTDLLIVEPHRNIRLVRTTSSCLVDPVTLVSRLSLFNTKDSVNWLNLFNFTLKPGMILPGVVKKKMTYGLFVEINGLTGLVPIKVIRT